MCSSVTDLLHSLPSSVCVHTTEIFHANNPRARSREMRRAIMAEVQNLLHRETFKVVLREELTYESNALAAFFVLGIKPQADNQVKFKARDVIGRHREI